MKAKTPLIKEVTHRDGEISETHPNAVWYQCLTDKRWMLKCTCTKQLPNGKLETCSYHERECRYSDDHKHIMNSTVSKTMSKQIQQTLFDVSLKKGGKQLLISLIAQAVAELNISSSAIASSIMISLLNKLIKYGYQLAKDNEEISELMYTDKEINSQIIIEQKSRYKHMLDSYRSYGIANAIVDAGTVKQFHTLEIILVLPGLLDPFPYKSYQIEDGDIANYKTMFTELFKNLFEDKIQLISICGDNLPAQRNGADHTKPNSIQQQAYDTACEIYQRLLSEKQELSSDITKQKDIAKLKENLAFYSQMAAILYIPCLSHVLNLSFNDMMSSLEIIQTYNNKIEQYNELFRIPEIKKEIGVLHYSICPTRWLYLFDALVYLFQNRRKLHQLYDAAESNPKIRAILDETKFEEIASYPNDLITIINILWPLHSFSIYIETEQTLLCHIVPILDKVVMQIRERCKKYNMENLGNSIIDIINNRFQNTGRWDLIKAGFMLTPYGRRKTQSKDNPNRKASVSKPKKIDFFELVNESEAADGEVRKFKNYIIKSQKVTDEVPYYYFEDRSEENLLNDEAKANRVKETILDHKQLKIIMIKNIKYLLDLTNNYSNREHTNFISECKNVLLSFHDFVDEYHSYLNLNNQDNTDLSELSLYIDGVINGENQLFDAIKFKKYLKDISRRIKKLEIHSDAFKELIEKDLYNQGEIMKSLEKMDIFSEEMMFQIASVVQKLEKKTIWNSINVIATCGEDFSCMYTVNEMAKILFPQLNGGELITPYLDEYIGQYCFDNQNRLHLADEIFRGYHPILYWKKLSENIPELKPLGQIAMRLVSLPASEAGCERMFSKRKKIISAFHTRISNELAFSRAFLMSTRSA